MQGESALLNVITIPPGATNTSPRIVLDGVRGALFVYGSGGPVGALIGSWAGQAGTDPYGNAYPAGINVSLGSITGISIVGGSFRAKNASGATIMTINISAGVWILYQDLGSSTQGPVLASGNNSGSIIIDEFGFNILSGLTAYAGFSGAWTALSVAGSNFFFYTSSASTQISWNGQSNFQFTLNSPVVFGNSALGINIGSNDQLGIPSGNGPFTIGETGWHVLSNPSGFTGTMRVKLLPWNAVWYDVEGSTNAAGTFSFGAPPSSAYNPTTARHFDTGGATVNGRIFIPTSGGPQVITGAASAVGGTWTVPTN